jgi:hypothetical protein
MLDAIDTRRNLQGYSRNEWITRALAWALDQPIRTTTKTEKL